ncbi:MAG TPA: UvrD-helicase domain-containing protein, partial [Opitutaceae bacterium]
MSSRPSDQRDRDRFTNEWDVNLAVVANAGSGKTTAISERLAAIAMSPLGAEILARTAVVTYTNKAAAQIGQRTRGVLLRRLSLAGSPGMDPLARLDTAFFGTIHSFCILMARRHGSALGVHLNPTLIDESDDDPWEEFLEQDSMQFSRLASSQIDAFLRHASLDDVFGLARGLEHAVAARLVATEVAARPPAPSAAALAVLLGAVAARKGRTTESLQRNKDMAVEWVRRFDSESGRLPIPSPAGSGASIEDHYRRLFAPLKEWLGAAGGVLAAELSLRFRAWRQDRGFQTYADQVETALSVLSDRTMLEKIRGEGWRVILDEAQDTDPSQFAVLAEITRPPLSEFGAWPGRGGAGPRPGHFCMVGDAQQGIFSDRADIRNFLAHVDAFGRGDGGERLTFDVTFRLPAKVVELLNATLPEAFGPDRTHNMGLPPGDGAPARILQVDYEPLETGPSNLEGGAWRLPVSIAAPKGTQDVADRKLADEARQVAECLRLRGPPCVGAARWGDICVLAPRREWLPIIRGEFERAGIRTALQMRRNRNGDNPAYAWLCGLLSVICDPQNTFEWVGVLREIFGVSDSLIAGSLRGKAAIEWDEPGDFPEPIRRALEVLGPFISRADQEGDELGRFASGLAEACGLRQKALALDPAGAFGDELDRLVARASEMGTQGSGPRAWLSALLASVDEFRAPGRPAADSVNMITSHSAKGLEWPVVVPLGFWRTIGHKEPSGLRIVSEWGRVPRIVFDNASVDAETRESRERERLRVLVRLLYVTVTRSKVALVLPWSGGLQPEKDSFARLWGFDPGKLDEVPKPAPSIFPEGEAAPKRGATADPRAAGPSAPSAPFPRRILPHQLAGAPDAARSSLHEASIDEPVAVKEGTDPLEYGVWWHKMLEFVPWRGADPEVGAHGDAAIAGAAGKGFQERAREEWRRLLASEPWALMRN